MSNTEGITLEQLAKQVAELRKENKLLAKHNSVLQEKASLTHRPLAMWHNEGKSGKSDYWRVIITFHPEVMKELDKQKKGKGNPKLSFTAFQNDFKRSQEDPDFHGRLFSPEKQS